MPENRIVLVGQATIGKELEKMKGQIEAALPRHITPERMSRIALTALRKTPKLYQTTLESFFGAIITASQLGLEPGVNGQCYIIPYGQEATFVPGWRGWMDLVSRTGRANAWTGAVYEQDEFDYEYGTKPFIHHKPGKWTGNPKALEFVYAVGSINGIESPTIEVWPIERVWTQRDRNNKCKNKTDHYSYAHPEMYARKLPLLQVIKYLPSSVEILAASSLEISGSEGRQHLTIEGSLAKNFDGGPTEKELEIERLMNLLNWTEEKRESVRDNYPGRTDELLEYVREQAAPLNGGKADASKKGTDSAAKRRGGRSDSKAAPESEAAEQEHDAKQEQQSSQQQDSGRRPAQGSLVL
jgi:recombination protein RecT